MPELPEVETVRRCLAKLLKDKPQIERVELRRSKLREPIPEGFVKSLVGQTIEKVGRKSKYLVWQTEDYFMVSHLGMTGSWRTMTQLERGEHDHVILHLSDGQKLVYHDPRRFGVLDLVHRREAHEYPRFQKMGVEPLSKKFTPEYLHKKCRYRNATVKFILMDQSIIAGLGNIYAIEALFEAGIRPMTRGKDLTLASAKKLVNAIKGVLHIAIDKGGSSVRDFKNLEGKEGYFQKQFRVYGRQGKECFRCENTVQYEKLSGRGTMWCDHCQK